MDNFSIYSCEATKEDVIVTFTAPEGITEYVCRVYKDDEKYQVIKGNGSTDITLDTSGNFIIKVEGKDKWGNTQEYTSGTYIVDKEAPMLAVGSSTLTMRIGDELKVSGGVKAIDNMDGDITHNVMSNINSLFLDKVGTQTLTYTIYDNVGNMTTKDVTINIVKNNNGLLIGIQLVIIVLFLSIIAKLIKYLNSIRMEIRFASYSVETKVDKSKSLFDIFVDAYDKLVKRISSVLKKSVFINDYAKRFNKYMLFTKDRYDSSIDIISSKVVISIIFLIIAIIAKALQYKTIGLYEIVVPMVLGFFVLDIIYFLQYRMYRNQIENDLLQAVIVMNNAFKSGRSITQAIELVGNELPGIIGDQFCVMRKELSKGLSVDVVFKRFADRIEQEEVNYLTASLTILNKTGGNIIKVFTAIENSLFMKKKLRLELKSLTGSSKIIMWVLFLIPIAYVSIISLLNPAYFDAFFTTTLGLILCGMVLILYIIYIFVVRKILKVRM